MNEAATQNWNTQESGATNLYKVIQFYRAFPNLDALRLNLSWTDFHLTTFSYDSLELVSWVREFENQIEPTENRGNAHGWVISGYPTSLLARQAGRRAVSAELWGLKRLLGFEFESTCWKPMPLILRTTLNGVTT